MGFLRKFGGALGVSARSLSHTRPDLLSQATYRFSSSERGLPMVGLDLTFSRYAEGAANPEMSLALLLDRSGSMTETYNDGHVYNAASTILSYVASASAGLDLVFYDYEPSFYGHVRSNSDLQMALNRNQPRGGGTYVTAALQGTIERYRTQRGIYIIVVTDGEFADKLEVQQYIVAQLLPQLTPENPYAFRLHFVGAGEEVDREFLQGLEAAASGQGAIQMVKHHHHAHLRHSHDSMLDELDRTFIGPGAAVTITQQVEAGQEPAVTRVGDLVTHRCVEGAAGTLDFVPRRATIGIEYGVQHPSELDLVIRYGRQPDREEIPCRIALPRVTAQAPVQDVAPKPARFHLPWHHATPEDQAAKDEAARERIAMDERIQQVRQAEQQRVTSDLQTLGRGGIPSMAQQRLAEIRDADPAHALFTSDLSPDEAALLRRNGYRPLGLVCGSAMYHVGTAYASAYSDCEVTVLSQAYNEATRLAVSRMEQEAQAIGAQGVVGVRFEIVRREWSEKSIEVQLLGTAVIGPGKAQATPWLSDLSGQEWWALHRAGYDPIGLVYGNCTWFVLTTQTDEWSERSWSNQELRHFSDALTACRNRANGMVTAMARQQQAVGVVGVHLSRRLEEIRLTGPGENPAYEREHHNLTLSLIGTAVRLRPDAPATIRATGNVLSLRDGRFMPTKVTTTAARFE